MRFRAEAPHDCPFRPRGVSESFDRGRVGADRQTQGARQDRGRQTPPWVALSGGGIRSATFNLGLLQALAQRQLLRRIDFLSTVSGGSFIGGFVGALISRGNSKHSLDGKTEGIELAEEVLARPSRILRWLRENGRYLAPNGSGDLLAAAADALRSWLTIQVLLVLALLTLFTAMLWAEPWITAQTATLGAYVPIPAEVMGWKFAPLVFAGGYLIPVLILAYWLISDWKNWLVDLAQWLLMLCVMGWALWTGLPPWLPVLIAAAMATAVFASRDWLSTDFTGQFSREKGFRRTTAWLSRVLVILIGGTLLTVLFWCGSTVAEAPYDTFRQVAAAVGGLVGAGLASGRVFAKLLPHIPARRLRDAGAMIVALVWLGMIVVACSAAAHALFSESRGVAAGTLAVVSFVIGLNRQILNRATLNPIYRARLGRAYVGASNNRRVPCSPTEPPRPITDPLEEDDVPWPSYAPHARGGPLHLIGMTVNETKSGRSSLEEHDRKGLSFCVGPAALSVSATYHAFWGEKRHDDERVPVFKTRPFSQRVGEYVPDALKNHETSLIHRTKEHRGYHALFTEENEEHHVECLTLGGWMAVSGAAVSTGVGAQTSLATSLLCTLANLRLGYWWDSHVPQKRKNTKDHWFWG